MSFRTPRSARPVQGTGCRVGVSGPRCPQAFLLGRAGVALLVILLVVSRGHWSLAEINLPAGLALLGWLASSSAAGVLGARHRNLRRLTLGALLFGDSMAAALAVRAVGGVQSSAVLLFALPVAAGSLVLRRRTALLHGAVTAVLYALLGIEELHAGVPSGQIWSAVIFHTLLFTTFGLAIGLVSVRMARLLHEAVRSRSELEAIRLSTDQVLGNLSCGLVAVEPTGALRILSPQARRLGPGEAEPEDIWQLLQGDNAPLLRLIEDHLRGDRDGADQEILLRPAGGKSFPAWLRVASVTGNDGCFHGLVVMFWDISARLAEEERARRRERLAAVGELSAGLAHEIRNSLKPITGCVELLRKRGGLPPAARPMTEVIEREADALEAFLSQFLELTQHKAVKFSAVDLEELIGAEAASLVVAGRWRGREIRIAASGATRAWGDRDWLRQIFRNLLINALEAAEGGVVDVDFTTLRRAGRNWLRIGVSDEGPGLQGLTASESFEPFRTTKSGGTGLGLAIVRRAVLEHSGRVAFDETRRPGARVVVELPAEPQAECKQTLQMA
ncbi:MAG: hypothetical protein GF330_14405 [Candidatus Eisenbacteria bacterium]|nr:hypothetical protein [Candidatus Eisenbacteria bacterium]